MRHRVLLGSTFLTAALFVVPQPASAQVSRSDGTVAVAPTDTTAAGAAVVADTATSGALGEVVVTARRREERLVDVPISIQNFSAAQLSADRITDLDQLQTQGGFTFNSQGASFFGGGREFPTLVFRGMTSNYGGGRADSGALFIDGIYISGGAASVTLSDASRVEFSKVRRTSISARTRSAARSTSSLPTRRKTCTAALPRAIRTRVPMTTSSRSKARSSPASSPRA